MKKYLFVKTSALGDILQSLFAVQDLKQRDPSAIIDFVVEKRFSDCILSHPLIRKTLIVDTKKWRKNPFSKSDRKEISTFIQDLRKEEYTAVFDLQGNSKSGLITKLVKANDKVGYSFKCVPEFLNIFATNQRFYVSHSLPITLQMRSLLAQYFQSEIDLHSVKFFFDLNIESKEKISQILSNSIVRTDKKILVCMGSNWINKVPSLAMVKTVLTSWAQKEELSFLFLWGSEKERKVANDLMATFSKNSISIGHLSIPTLHALIQKVSGVVAPDSSILHVVALTDTPSLSLFGPSSPLVYKPLGDKHHFFQGACPYGKKFVKRCPKLRTCKTGACLKDIKEAELQDTLSIFSDSLTSKSR